MKEIELDRIDSLTIKFAYLEGQCASIKMALQELLIKTSEQKLVLDTLLVFISEKLTQELNSNDKTEMLNLLTTFKTINKYKNEYLKVNKKDQQN